MPTTIPKCSRITAADPKACHRRYVLDGQIGRFKQTLGATHARIRDPCGRCRPHLRPKTNG